MTFERIAETLRKNRFDVRCFSTAVEAAAYLDSVIDGKSVAIGGSHTVQEMGLYPLLEKHNLVYFNAARRRSPRESAALWRASMDTEVYITGVNAVAEDIGALVNIDGRGNRIASTFYGHEKVYFLVGRNKLAPDLEGAIWRARNIAAPKNCRALGKKTPCAEKADRCYDCSSPDRGCNGLAVLWKRLRDCAMEVILIDEDLGF